MPAFLIETRARGIFMADLLEPIAAVAQSFLAPGLTFFRHYPDDAAQQTLAGKIARAVLQEALLGSSFTAWIRSILALRICCRAAGGLTSPCGG
jgi:hypothetical protein